MPIHHLLQHFGQNLFFHSLTLNMIGHGQSPVSMETESVSPERHGQNFIDKPSSSLDARQAIDLILSESVWCLCERVCVCVYEFSYHSYQLSEGSENRRAFLISSNNFHVFMCTFELMYKQITSPINFLSMLTCCDHLSVCVCVCVCVSLSMDHRSHPVYKEWIVDQGRGKWQTMTTWA